MIVAATCATLAAMLSYVSAGDTIQITGDCGPVEISRSFTKPVIIDATQATIRGLRITGANIDWRGGTLRAQDGLQGVGPRGYALYVSGTGVSISSATITDARMGAVVVNARNVKFRKNRFWRLRSDGINTSMTNGLTVSYNRFEESIPNPTKCILASGKVLTSVSYRNCDGTWIDGDHADAVQMRNGVENAVLDHNVVSGNTQGLTQMDTTGDLPLKNVRLWANVVQVAHFHTLTLYTCTGCRIDGNTVKRPTGSTIKAIIREGAATRCGNSAQDQPGLDPVCA